MEFSTIENGKIVKWAPINDNLIYQIDIERVVAHALYSNDIIDGADTLKVISSAIVDYLIELGLCTEEVPEDENKPCE